MARGAEVFADRWTPLIVREMLAGISHFNDLQRGLPGISRSLLSQRLRQLQRVGIVDRRLGPNGKAAEYLLTTAGRDLQVVIDRLGEWAAEWVFGDPRPEELDPVLLLWFMRRRINADMLPPRRVVIEFEFTGPRRARLWLVLQRSDVSVCLQNPGFEIDLVVTADLATFYRVWLGRTDLDSAVSAGSVRIDGPPAFVRAFPRWLQWSPMAQAVRMARSA